MMDNKSPFFPSDPGSEPGRENPEASGNSAAEKKNEGSYEVAFDAGSEENTGYRQNGYNAYGFNANGSGSYYASGSSPNSGTDGSDSPKSGYSPRLFDKKSDRKRWSVTLLLTLSIVFFTLSAILSAATILLLPKANPDYTIKNPPGVSETLLPWVNPGELDHEEAGVNAAAKASDSVVMIAATSQNSTSNGSGLIWASNSSVSYSYILTCHHVIEGQDEIKVTLNNNASYYAELVGSDPRTDIAILRIEASGLPAVVLPSEDSSLHVGQSVIAIGNPLGTLGNTVTDGMLSSLARTITVEGTTMEVVQTSAAVNRGNSGGGLFDMNGQLIGMVNAKVSQASVEGIGFAIPYSTLKTIAGEIIEKGYVSGRPRLGITTVEINSLDSYLAAIKKYPDLEAFASQKTVLQSYFIAGIYIVDASDVLNYAEGSAEFEFGDRIYAIGAAQVTSGEEITAALNQYAAGDSIQVTVVRRNNLVSIQLTLGELGK